MRIVDVNSEEFNRYGVVIKTSEISVAGRENLVAYLTTDTEAPVSGNVYVADDGAIHQMAVADEIKSVLAYDEVQFGYCHGNSSKVNALEWHECQELVLAATECALYLGHPEALVTVEGHLNFDSKNLIAVQLKQGEIIRLEPRIMHFAPTKVTEDPYRTLIVLEKGTNTPLEHQGEGHLFMENKWLITHSDRQDLVEKGAWPGLVGLNYDWQDLKDL